MLTFEEAKKIGINACMEKMGRDFVHKYASTSCLAYGEEERYAYCFVGVDTAAPEEYVEGEGLVLDSSEFPYMVSCTVMYEDGKITFIKDLTP